MATKRVCDMTPEEHELHLQKRREYYQNNKDKFKQYSKKYMKQYQYKRYHKDEQYKEKVLDANKKCRKKRGPEYIKNYMKEYRKNNDQYRQSESIRGKQRILRNIEQGITKPKQCVYMIKCNKNNKIYLGYCSNAYKLQNTPISYILGKFEKSSDIYKDYVKYTENQFELSVVWVSQQLPINEMVFISKLYFSFYYKLYNTGYDYIDFDIVKRRYSHIIRGKNGGKSK